jgi:hypothetical protein
MICAVHALVGAALGKLIGRQGGSLAAGVSSHLLGDLLPHKDFAPKVEAPLLAVTMGFLALKFGLKSPEFLGAFGGIAPDFENAASVAGIIPREAMRFPTHLGDDKHGPKVNSALPQGILAAACLAFLLWPKKK